MLSQAGWEVEQGALYVDPVTGKSREIDLVARYDRSISLERGTVGLVLLIECKVIRRHPYVSFASRTKRDAADVIPLLGHGTVAQTALLMSVATSDEYDLLTIRSGERIGHGIAQAHSKRKDDINPAFTAVRSAVGAATALGINRDNLVRSWAGYRTVEIFLPIVAVDGFMYEYYLDDNGKEELSSSGIARVVSANPLVPSESVLVHVVTDKYIPLFLERLNRDFETLFTCVADGRAEIIEAARMQLTARKDNGL